MNPARAKSLFDGPFKNLGHSLKVANLSVKLTYSGYFQEQEIPSFGGGIFFTGRVTCFVFTFSSFCLLCESDQFHEKLALESISHDADDKQSKEHASTALREKLGQLSVSTRFNPESTVDDILLPQGSTNVMRKLSNLILLIVIHLVN